MKGGETQPGYVTPGCIHTEGPSGVAANAVCVESLKY